MSHERGPANDASDETLRDSNEDFVHDDENSPLLAREEGVSGQHDDRSQPRSSAVSSLLRINSSESGKKSLLRRWPSLLALAILVIAIVVILVLGFVTPQVAKEYASQAATFEPTRLSIANYTDTGVIARVQGHFELNADHVEKNSVRNLGRFGTWIARTVETDTTSVQISLPLHGDIILGTATIPPLNLWIVNSWVTPIDVLVNLAPGPHEGLRQVVHDWIDGKIDEYVIKATAVTSLKSGIARIGQQTISQTLSIDSDQVPTVPNYKIKRLNFHEINTDVDYNGIAADVSVNIENKYPVEVQIPTLGFSVSVDNCLPSDPHIMLADARTQSLRVHPKEDVLVNATGFVNRLPEAFLAACPGQLDSPFDNLLGDYIHGREATLYVSGSRSPPKSTPQWISDLAYGVTVPVSFTGRPFGNLIKNFSMTDVRFSLPDFFAEPDTPDAQPKISAQIKALIGLPDEMNFHVDVNKIRSTADVFYHKKKLGVLDLSRWHNANSTEVRSPSEDHPDLVITSHIEKAPLQITDEDVFQDLVNALLTGRNTINLEVKAAVDVQMITPLGPLAVRQIPAKGNVPVKPMGGSSFSSLSPKFNDLRVVETSPSSMKLAASVNFTNPTKYSASVPYADVNILVNGTVMGHGIVEDVSFQPGNNSNIPIQAIWEPSARNGTLGASVGRELLSEYISGYNTTVTIKTHEGTIPSQPSLGRALQPLEFTIPVPMIGDSPKPGQPGDGDGEHQRPHFIKETTMHLITSSANFILSSPLKHTTLILTYINATAFYHDEDVGRIVYEEDLVVPPGDSETPKLPVDWSIGSVGYDAIKNALGGTLKLKAFAHVGVKIGKYEDRVWYRGRSIGAKVRL